jgi:RimJ/RimL family protein N-acetyltransferase
MRIHIRAASPSDVKSLALEMRERDEEEFLSSGFCETKQELSDELYAQTPYYAEMLTAEIDGKPLAVFGIALLRPGVASVLFFANDDFRSNIRPLARVMRSELIAAMKRHKLHRVEAACLKSHTDAQNWMKILGMVKEADLKAFGRRGEDFELWRRTK